MIRVVISFFISFYVLFTYFDEAPFIFIQIIDYKILTSHGNSTSLELESDDFWAQTRVAKSRIKNGSPLKDSGTCYTHS